VNLFKIHHEHLWNYHNETSCTMKTDAIWWYSGFLQSSLGVTIVLWLHFLKIPVFQKCKMNYDVMSDLFKINRGIGVSQCVGHRWNKIGSELTDDCWTWAIDTWKFIVLFSLPIFTFETFPKCSKCESNLKWWRWWIQVQYIWYIVRTFVNATMYSHPP
jgi:hypothetical protein